MSKTQCQILSDGEIMRMVMERGVPGIKSLPFCHKRQMLRRSTLGKRLFKAGVTEKKASYVKKLSECQQCTFYKGEYPCQGKS